MSTLWLGILIFLCIINTLVSILAIYVVVRLNKYIGNLEETTDENIERTDNLQQTMQKALKEDLFRDGTIRGPLVSKDDMNM